jgi:hypothetical protein
MKTSTHIIVWALLAVWAISSVLFAITLDTALTHPLAHHKTGAFDFIYGQAAIGAALIVIWRARMKTATATTRAVQVSDRVG